MTALPNPLDFVSVNRSTVGSPEIVRPRVKEYFWGYEISKNENMFDLAFVARSVAIIVSAIVAIFITGLWSGSISAFWASGMAPQLLGTLILLGLGMPLFKFASRSTRVRVQVDTSTGEIREVVSGLFGSSFVLAQYGVETVDTVLVAVSKLHPSQGQVQITLKGGTVFPVGDGALMTLRPLRDRIASDCGVGQNETMLRDYLPTDAAA